jgi:hypothetical protein
MIQASVSDEKFTHLSDVQFVPLFEPGQWLSNFAFARKTLLQQHVTSASTSHSISFCSESVEIIQDSWSQSTLRAEFQATDVFSATALNNEAALITKDCQLGNTH